VLATGEIAKGLFQLGSFSACRNPARLQNFDNSRNFFSSQRWPGEWQE
jgi:hypothetical protein